MSAIRNITWKYLQFFSKSRAVMAMTIISLLGIAIGVATLTVTLSVANGFGKEYRRSILDFSAHVVLLSTEEIEDSGSVLKRLARFNVSPEERKEWQESEYIISLLKITEYMWIKLDQLYIDLQYNVNLPTWFFELVDRIHPRNVAEGLYVRGWYPKLVVDRIVDILRLSERGIVGVNPFLYREGLLIHKGLIRGVVIKGVDPVGMEKVSSMRISLGPPSSDQIFLGSYLAKEIGAEKGDKVRIMLPEHWGQGGTESFEEFIVGGTFESGMYDFDSQFALLDLNVAQQIFNAPDKVSGIEIKLDDWRKSPLFARRLEREFTYPIYAADWQELNRSLFQAVKLEKLMFVIIMGALVVVAAFNIIGTVMLRILYKTSDISILRALGMKTKAIKKVFVMQGLFVGVLGTTLGVVLALVLMWSINKFGWIKIPPEIYLLKTLPVCISWLACVMIAAFSILVCWITSRIASNKILELPLVRGLHRP